MERPMATRLPTSIMKFRCLIDLIICVSEVTLPRSLVGTRNCSKVFPGLLQASEKKR